MKLYTVKGFELYNMNRPDPYNETMQFRTRSVAESIQRVVGGQIRETVIHEKES